MAIHALEPRFQALLRPLVVRPHGVGVIATQMALATCARLPILGVTLCLQPAREFGQTSDWGACLNELTDVVSDAAIALIITLVEVPRRPGDAG